MGEFTHVSRAPGRVNLIGDHTDYNGLPVLPMAIRQAVTLRFRPRPDPVVRIASDLEGLPRAEFRLDEPLRPHGGGDWRNYLHAGALVLHELVPRGGAALLGIDGEVGGDLPAAAGLSSSSALVVATGLALLHANGSALDNEGLPEVFARAERYVGTAGGGMDQTASLHGRAGCALRIDFDPIRVRAIPVPDPWCFVVAHSGEIAEKSGGAQAIYNARVAACRSALATLRSRAERGGREAPNTYTDVLAHADRDYWEWALAQLDGEERACFQHTVSEGQRVVEAERMLRGGDGPAFGRLMSASHESLASHYRVSTDRLDTLVATAFETGAFGARLTGAGLGGCVVALVERSRAADVEEALRAQVARWESRPVVFRAAPAQGAGVSEL